MEKQKSRTFLQKVTTIHGTNHFQVKSGNSRMMWWLAMTANLLSTVLFIMIIRRKLRNDQIFTKIDSTCPVNKVPFPAVSICNMNAVSLKGTENIARLLKNHNRTEKEIDKFFNDLPKLKRYETPEADNATEIMHILKSYYYTMDTIMEEIDSTCPVNKVPFPAVSICNMNAVSLKGTENIARLLKNHNRTEKEIDKFFNDLPKLKRYETPEADNATEIMHILKSYYYTMDTIMEEVYQKCENMLLYCTFNRKVKNCFDIFSLIKTVEGHCCAFNYAALNDVSEVSLLPHDDTLEYYDGDEESDHVSGPIIATSESGRKSGLTVVFNVEPDDYPSWSTALNYGATILISDPNDFPETSVRDQFITIGTTVDINVVPLVYQSESDLRTVAPAHRACWFHDEVALEHTDRYSYETCSTECNMNNFIHFCGCTPYKYPRDESRRFCELVDLPCMYNLTVYGKGVPCDPICYVECRDKGYKIKKNTVPFFATDFPPDVTSGRDVNHLAAVKVYFGKSTCNCYKLTLLMDVNYMIATYGGVLGLSFGASLLTVAELIYLVVSTICEHISKYININTRRELRIPVYLK